MKYAQSTSVRQLIQKIENHPDRHALQKDLQQNQSFNLFSSESKQMIRDVENNPKRSAKYVYHTGTLVSSIARAGTSCEKKERIHIQNGKYFGRIRSESQHCPAMKDQ